MKQLSIEPIPNQSIRAQLDGAAWEVGIRTFDDIVLATVSINGVVIISGIRCQVNTRILPYEYQEDFGNLVLYGQDDLLYENFGSSILLYHLSKEELEGGN